MLELVKYNDANGNAVEFTAEDVRARLCPNIEPKELALVMGLCQSQNLNPFTKDVYIIKYGNSPAAIVTSKDVFIKRANAQKSFKGFEAGITYATKDGKILQREGSAFYKAAGEKLLGGWARVFVDGKTPFYDEVALEEYTTSKGNWIKMPGTMIRKVAVCHALREAYSDNMQGLYGAEEMGEAGEQVNAMESKPAPTVAPYEVTPVEVVELATAEQVEQLQKAIWTLADLRGVTDETIISALLNCKALDGLDSLADATETEAAHALEQLARWTEKARAEQPTAPQFAEQPTALDVAIEQAETAEEIPF